MVLVGTGPMHACGGPFRSCRTAGFMAPSAAASSVAIFLLLACCGCQAAESPGGSFEPVDLQRLPFSIPNSSLSALIPSWLVECSADRVRQTAACGHHVVIVGDALSPTFRVFEAVAVLPADGRQTSVAAYIPLGASLDVPIRPAERVASFGVVTLGTPLSVPPVCHPRGPLYKWQDPAAAGARSVWSVPPSGGVYLWSYTLGGAWRASSHVHSPSWRSGLDPTTFPGGVRRRVVRAVVVRDGTLYWPIPRSRAMLEDGGKAVTWEDRDIKLGAPGLGQRFTVDVSPDGSPHFGSSVRFGSRGAWAALLGGLGAMLVAGAASLFNAGCAWTARSRLRRRNAAWDDLSRRLAAGALSPTDFGAAAARLAAEEDVLAAAARLGHTPEHRRRLAQLVTTRQLTGEIDLTECNRRLGVLAAEHKVLAAEAANGAGWAAPGRWLAEAEAWLDNVALASDGPVARALDAAIQRGWFQSSQGEFVGTATAAVVVVWGLYMMQR